SSATREATSSPATTGSTGAARRRSGRWCSIAPGNRPGGNGAGGTGAAGGGARSAPERLLGMNFGTGTVESAVAYVEYCNVDRGTRWSELRRAHGYPRALNVRYWCTGNAMDGPC